MSKNTVRAAMPVIAGGIAVGFRAGWLVFVAVALGLGLLSILAELAIDYRKRNR